VGHGHGHDHTHAPKSPDRAFAVGVVLNVAFVLVEVVFGLLAHSVALLSDAGHNLSDVLGLLLAWGAATLARRQPSARRTYGLRRSTILVALANAILLLVAVGGITWEAIRRFLHPEPVAGGIVIGVAAVGVLVNGVTAALFLSGRKTDLNVRGAFLHMAADAAVSLGVVLAGFGMVATGWVWLDPAVALAIVAVITIGTWGLLRESLDLAMDAVPTGIDPEEVESYLSSLPGVASVHDLHIWAMSTTESALTVHVVCPSRMEDDALSRVCSEIHRRFGIEHCTIQLELGTGAKPCPQAHEEAV
jgi:cobalt-zinc-cadmium efflux system protein